MTNHRLQTEYHDLLDPRVSIDEQIRQTKKRLALELLRLARLSLADFPRPVERKTGERLAMAAWAHARKYLGDVITATFASGLHDPDVDQLETLLGLVMVEIGGQDGRGVGAAREVSP